MSVLTITWEMSWGGIPTSRRGKCCYYNIPEDRERENSRHYTWGDIFSEYCAEKQSGHIDAVVYAVIE